MYTLGFAGVAKNTGKTTTALAVLQLAQADGLRLALTSIGYDGEDRDNVTGLPKPRYALPSGCLVASAQRCLQASPAGLRLLHNTGIATILGPVLIAEVTQPGLVLIAGPNQQAQIEKILQQFAALGAELCLLDGALNRLTPLAAADGLLLSTGAAFDEDPARLMDHAAALTALFGLSQPATDPLAAIAPQPANQNLASPGSSLLSPQAAEQLAQQLRISQQPRLTLTGAAAPQHCLTVQTHLRRPITWVFGNPLRMIAAGDPRSWRSFLAQVQADGGTVHVLHTLPLHALTLNPFYPRYLAAAGRYEAAFLPAADLLAQARARLPAHLPVLDLHQQGTAALRPHLPFLKRNYD
jgi:hypothetical protein